MNQPISFPPIPANETKEEKQKRESAEREQYFKHLIETKYPELKQEGMGLQNKEVQARSNTRSVRDDDPFKTSIVPDVSKGIEKDPTIRELNRAAERIVYDQVAYYVQMAHKHRSPHSDVPWFRIVGCESRALLEDIVAKGEPNPWKSQKTWGAHLAKHLVDDQKLTVYRFQRTTPFMICLDERYQVDAETDKRIKRLLSLYETEFVQQKSRFLQHKKTGLTEDEHKTRSSHFAKEQAWREAKKRHDASNSSNSSQPQSSETSKTVEAENTAAAVYLRNHGFPESLKQPEHKFAIISYFRDLLAFQRCFHDLKVSVEDADFQPVIIIWGVFETQDAAKDFCEQTRCNHAFLQKNLSVVDTYKWIPLDHVNTHNIPIQYANKYCNDVMSYRQAQSRAIEDYHAWERERYGEEAAFAPPSKH